MKNIGYIKLHRQIRDNMFFQEKRVFSKFEAWIEILLECNYSDNKFMLGNKIIDVEKGSFVCSKNDLALRFGWGKKKLYNFFSLLEGQKMVEQKGVGGGHHRRTFVKVFNYSKYQIEGTSYDTTDDTSLTPPKKNNKEYNKITLEKIQKFAEENFQENNTAYLLKGFFDLGYIPSKTETVETFRKWFKEKILDNHNFKTTKELNNVIDNFTTYWGESEKQIKNFKTTFLNNPILKSYQK